MSKSFISHFEQLSSLLRRSLLYSWEKPINISVDGAEIKRFKSSSRTLECHSLKPKTSFMSMQKTQKNHAWVETLAALALLAVRGHKGKLQLGFPPHFAKQNSHPITEAHLNELLWRIPFACTWKGFWWLQNKFPYIYMSRQGAIWIIGENVGSFMKIKIKILSHKEYVTHSHAI